MARVSTSSLFGTAGSPDTAGSADSGNIDLGLLVVTSSDLLPQRESSAMQTHAFDNVPSSPAALLGDFGSGVTGHASVVDLAISLAAFVRDDIPDQVAAVASGDVAGDRFPVLGIFDFGHDDVAVSGGNEGPLVERHVIDGVPAVAPFSVSDVHLII